MKPNLTKLSVMELLVARDEAIATRDDLRFFFGARFVKASSTNDSNPLGMPMLSDNTMQSELVAMQKRKLGLEIQALIEQFDGLIHDITAEILDRS